MLNPVEGKVSISTIRSSTSYDRQASVPATRAETAEGSPQLQALVERARTSLIEAIVRRSSGAQRCGPQHCSHAQ